MSRPNDKLPVSGGLSNVGLTITIDAESPLAPRKEQSHLSQVSPSTVAAKQQKTEKATATPVKVRLFDIGGIGEPKSHALLLPQQHQHSSLVCPTMHSITFEERERVTQSKLSQHHESKMKLKKLQTNIVGGTVGGLKGLLNKKSHDISVNDLQRRASQEACEQSQVQQVALYNRIDTSLLRDLNTSSAASRAAFSKHDS